MSAEQHVEFTPATVSSAPLGLMGGAREHLLLVCGQYVEERKVMMEGGTWERWTGRSA